MFNKNKEKIYFITGGGTGGHIYPAVSVINTLIDSGVDKKNIFYLGNKKNMEYNIAKKQGYNFLSYNASGMPRKINLDFILWLFNLSFSIFHALFYVMKYHPSVIFATGGYVCAPILFCAKFLNIPYVLHESDIHPGLVTKLFSKSAKCVSLGFMSAKEQIKAKKVMANGNPIRKEFKEISKAEARKELSLKDKFTILIMGGSLGAKKINDSSFKILKEYANKEDYEIIWQTGNKNFDEVVKKILDEYEELPDNLLIQPFFDKMYLVMLSSDIVISRAGSLSLSEICACSLPSILIPYPYATCDHQKKNAQELVKKDVALMLEDKDCNNETLFNLVDKLIKDNELLYKLSTNAKNEARLDSANKIVEQINLYIKK